MNARRLGCLSGSSLLAVALTLLLALGVTLVRGGRWFSPGPLNAQASGAQLGGGAKLGGVTSHAATGGRCQACHTAPWDRTTLADRCLACHTAINAELADRTSLHGALKTLREVLACRECHTEHRGPAADLTHMDPATFPHNAVGYSLAGHRTLADGRPFACADCHADKFTAFDVAICQTCHRDTGVGTMQQHVADFGAACLTCHDGVDRYGREQFDHNRFAFPLSGKHAGVACAQCHFGARTVNDFLTTPQPCVGCHQQDEPHRGQLGADCAACHRSDGWLPATFDHNQGGFPLTGKHAQAGCAQCHANQVYRGTPNTCVGCHQDPTYHPGVFGAACADCHTADGWQPAKYGRPHTFPLAHGENGVNPCRTCHPDQLRTYTCYGCHEHEPAEIEREHRNEGINDFTDCVRCHATGIEDQN